MSRLEDNASTEPSEAVTEKPEPQTNTGSGDGMNGSLNGITGPIYNPAPITVPRLIVDIEQGMEVDEEDNEEVPELQYFRSHGEIRTRPGSASLKSSKPFDAVSM
jgi:hypothetical protein